MRKSKILSLLLLLLFCTFGFSFKSFASENTYEMNFTAFNQTRGTNQVIIYTYENRTSDNKTGTNVWGYEISVDENGIIVQLGVNVTFAENGFVISAHGDENIAFIHNNVNLGDKVSYDATTKVITFSFSILGSISKLESDIKDLKNIKIELDLGAYDIDIESFTNDINNIEQKYDELVALSEEIKNTQDTAVIKEKEKLAQEKYEALLEEIQKAYLKTIISNKVESRGVWHRPNIYDGELSITGITNAIEEFKSVGINQIYVETLWWGHTIGTSEYMDYHPYVRDGDYGDYKDYLSAFIDIAHKNNIEVHAWTHTFYSINVKYTQYYPKWLKNNPEWLNLTYDGGYSQTGKGTEEGFIFIDPANEGARNFMTNVYKELVENYDFDGIQFDYIRYPDETSLEHSSGYTEAAMNAFKEENNIDSSSDLKTLLTSEKALGKDELYSQWKEWRAEQVTKFVHDTVKAVREIDKDINFSIAVGADYVNAKSHLMQDWKTWVENGWIDIIAPMAYTHDVEWVKHVVKSMNALSNGLTYNYTGIGAFMEGTPISYSDQILASRDLHGLGSVIFASQNILGQTEMKTVLSEGLNKYEAISPNSDLDLLLDTVFSYILDKSDRIYIPKELMTESQKISLSEKLENIKKMPLNNANDYNTIINEIKTLIFDLYNYMNSTAAQRVKEDLFYLIDIIDIKISRYLINYGYWDPETTSERPETDSFEYPVVEEEKEESNNNLIYIIGSASLVLVVGASTILFIRKKK